MKKLRIIVLLFILAFSFNVKAEVFFEIDCDSNDIINDKPINCDGNLIYENEGINDIELSYNTNLDIKFIPVNGFSLNCSNGKVTIHTDKTLSDEIMNSTKIMGITLSGNSKSKELETVIFNNIKINKTNDIIVENYEEEFNVSYDKEIKLDSTCTLDSITIEKTIIKDFDKNKFEYRGISVNKDVIFIDGVRSSDKSSASGLGQVRVPRGETIKRDITVVAEDGTKNIYKLFITNTLPKEEVKEEIVDTKNEESRLADEIITYPAFTDGTWSENSINGYCNEHNLKCTITKVKSTEETGTIIYQSRNKGDKVETGADLLIKISEKEETKEEVKSADNTLKSLEVYYNNKRINFDFSSNQLDYNLEIETSDTKKIKVKATLNSDKSTFVSSYGPRDVSFDKDNFEVLVKVKAENNDEKTYKLNIKTSPLDKENEIELKLLRINDKEVNLEEEKYEVRLPYNIEKSNIEAVANNKQAKIEYQDVDLKVGDNPVKITVSLNGKSKEYDVNIIREDKEELFEKIEITGYDINFFKDKKSYSLKISKETNELEIKIVPSNIDFEVLNNKNLHNGSKIEINVLDKEGEHKYTIHVEKDNLITNIICYGIFAIGIVAVIVAVNKVMKNKKHKKVINIEEI